MPNYIIFRAVTPPGFNMEEYAKRSSEPIRFDCVTCVEADTPDSAIDAVIGATGYVAASLVAVEGYVKSYATKTSFGSGGLLKASSGQHVLEGGSDDE